VFLGTVLLTVVLPLKTNCGLYL